MKASTLHENNASGIEWKVFALGATLGANGTSDFTATGTGQTFVLDTIEAGDIVLSHLCRVELVKPISHAATWKIQVGITGDLDRFIGDAAGGVADIKATDSNGNTLVPASTALADHLAYVRANGSAINLLATVAVGSGNVSDTTAGEIWIVIPIIRFKDRVTRRIGV